MHCKYSGTRDFLQYLNIPQLWEEVGKSRSRRERCMIIVKSQTECPGEMEKVDNSKLAANVCKPGR